MINGIVLYVYTKERDRYVAAINMYFKKRDKNFYNSSIFPLIKKYENPFFISKYIINLFS
jgi:hypothetical protein